MHELSLLENMLDQLSDMKQKYNLSSITDVYVSVGEMAGVDISFLESAYNLFIPSSDWAHLKMHITSVPWRIRCMACGLEQKVDDWHIQCRSCGSNDTETIDGTDFLIQKIEGEPHV
ncbi:MAG: hydrogenase accessory protein HypA [Pseudomonadota bacterium]|jgi:hydrogenase nickel incorporation protein HypA/HybF